MIRDNKGAPLFEGDLVRCVTHGYPSVMKGEIKKIIRVEEPNMVLANALSPIGTSAYRPDNFRLERRNQLENTDMLHIAVQWRAGASMADMASFLMNASSPPTILAGTTKEEIQQRIRDRLSQYPNEQWIICSGNTIGERADPPVRFRSL